MIPVARLRHDDFIARPRPVGRFEEKPTRRRVPASAASLHPVEATSTNQPPPGFPSAPVTDTAVTQLAQADARKGWRPPRLIFHTFVLLTALTLIWSASAPGWALSSLILGTMATFILGLTWAVRLVEALVRRDPSRWFLAAPALTGLAALIIASGAPLAIRWNLSQPAFDRAATSFQTKADDGGFHANKQRIGLYTIDGWDRLGDGSVVLALSSGGGLVVYYPPGTRLPTPGSYDQRLSERWSFRIDVE